MTAWRRAIELSLGEEDLARLMSIARSRPASASASAMTPIVRLSLNYCTYAKVAFAKLYDRKTPITAADLLNDRVVPFYDASEVKLCRILTDRGTEYCGNPEHHEYEFYLALEDIDHSRTKTKSPQTNGIVERFHKTVLDEFYHVAFRKKIYGAIAELQSDLDD